MLHDDIRAYLVISAAEGSHELDHTRRILEEFLEVTGNISVRELQMDHVRTYIARKVRLAIMDELGRDYVMSAHLTLQRFVRWLLAQPDYQEEELPEQE